MRIEGVQERYSSYGSSLSPSSLKNLLCIDFALLISFSMLSKFFLTSRISIISSSVAVLTYLDMFRL